jgi:hypothetical protein
VKTTDAKQLWNKSRSCPIPEILWDELSNIQVKEALMMTIENSRYRRNQQPFQKTDKSHTEKSELRVHDAGTGSADAHAITA